MFNYSALLKAILLSVLAFSSPSWGLNSLDGMVFVGEIMVEGEKDTESEVLRFEEGALYSESCEPWGFGKGTYKLEERDGTTHFTATTTSTKHGKIEWKGKIQGNSIDANYVWTKERWWWKDARQAKIFRGQLKQ